MNSNKSAIKANVVGEKKSVHMSKMIGQNLLSKLGVGKKNHTEMKVNDDDGVRKSKTSAKGSKVTKDKDDGDEGTSSKSKLL